MQSVQPRTDSGALFNSIGDPGSRYPLYDPGFAADPHRAYRAMRQRFGTLAPVDLAPGVPATLVLGYDTAIRILNDPDKFPADPREWQKYIAADHPLLPMIGYRPNPLRSAGTEHGVLREALTEALKAIDLHGVRAATARAAVPLINSFCGQGKAELLRQYVTPLVSTVLDEEIMGCPPHIGGKVTAAVAAMFESVDTATVEANLVVQLGKLLTTKQASPGPDVTSRLVHNATNLTDEQKFHQAVTMYAAGCEPMRNLMANSVAILLTDPRFQPDAQGFTRPVRDAVDHTLHHDPPMANYCLSYPRADQQVDGVWLPANQPVVISMAAATTDPKKTTGKAQARPGWHLAFSSGPHACPMRARDAALLTVEEGITYLFDALPELALAVSAEDLVYRQGPFQRALAKLPVVFPASPPLALPAP
ncbi:cytochrome P450 [Nocardia rhamnosiphila]